MAVNNQITKDVKSTNIQDKKGKPYFTKSNTNTYVRCREVAKIIKA